MRGKSLALLVLALGCGLVASIGVTQVIAKRHADAPAPTVDTESIFVVLEDVALGDPLTAQVLKLEPWPKSKIPEGAFTKIEDLEGRRARTKLFAGEPVIERKLLAKGENAGGISPLIPKGMRVVSVKVDRVSSGGGLILPGDRVDVVVFLTQATNRGIPESTTRTILQDIRVFAVNDEFDLETSDADKRSITNAQTVSLLVTPKQAQIVMLAAEMGKIRLILRSPEDDAQTELASATTRNVLSGGEGADREQEALMQPEPKDDRMADFMDFLDKNTKAETAPAESLQAVPTSPDNTTWNMRIVRAGQIEDVELHEQSGGAGQDATWRPNRVLPSAPAPDQPFPQAAPPTTPAVSPSADQPEGTKTSPDNDLPEGERE